MDTQEKEALAAGILAFGRHLMQERELRGLSRDEVSRLTKLAPSVIEALESGDSERMPPRGYLLGYLRTYSNAVGLDPDEVVLRWQEVVGVDKEPQVKARGSALKPVKPGAKVGEGGKTGMTVVLLVIAAALIALALLLGPKLAGSPRRASGEPGSESREAAPRGPP